MGSLLSSRPVIFPIPRGSWPNRQANRAHPCRCFLIPADSLPYEAWRTTLRIPTPPDGRLLSPPEMRHRHRHHCPPQLKFELAVFSLKWGLEVYYEDFLWNSWDLWAHHIAMLTGTSIVMMLPAYATSARSMPDPPTRPLRPLLGTVPMPCPPGQLLRSQLDPACTCQADDLSG